MNPFEDPLAEVEIRYHGPDGQLVEETTVVPVEPADAITLGVSYQLGQLVKHMQTIADETGQPAYLRVEERDLEARWVPIYPIGAWRQHRADLIASLANKRHYARIS